MPGGRVKAATTRTTAVYVIACCIYRGGRWSSAVPWSFMLATVKTDVAALKMRRVRAEVVLASPNRFRPVDQSQAEVWPESSRSPDEVQTKSSRSPAKITTLLSSFPIWSSASSSSSSCHGFDESVAEVSKRPIFTLNRWSTPHPHSIAGMDCGTPGELLMGRRCLCAVRAITNLCHCVPTWCNCLLLLVYLSCLSYISPPSFSRTCIALIPFGLGLNYFDCNHGLHSSHHYENRPSKA